MNLFAPIFCILVLLFLSWVAVDTYDRSTKLTTAFNSPEYLSHFLHNHDVPPEITKKLRSPKFGVKTLADFVELSRDDLVDAGVPRIVVSRYAGNRPAIGDYILSE